MSVELKVPDIGDFSEVEVIDVLIKPGDIINLDQDIITLESDKASMEIPASRTGKVVEVKIKVGDKVSEGDVIAVIEKQDRPAHESKSGREPEQELKSKSEPEPDIQQDIDSVSPYAPDDIVGKKKAHASPAVRKFARELGVNLLKVRGSGNKGRILKQDVEKHIKQRMSAQDKAPAGNGVIPPVPQVDHSRFGEITKIELSRINKLAGKHLYGCWLNIPHVTQFAEADITELEEFRREHNKDAKKQGIKLTPLVFIMKAAAAALKAYPKFNSSLDETEENLILKKYCNIGVAVDTPGGLVVPVIKDINNKGFFELAGELSEISPRAREGSLSTVELQGGTFTISSLGGIGGNYFTPIVNAPEVAILGVGRHETKPVWNGSKFKPRLMLPLSLSYNHKVIDGADGARFIAHLCRILSDIRKVLL